MPVNQHSINLIRTKTNISPENKAVEQSVRKNSIIFLVIFVLLSFVVGTIYLYYSNKINIATAQKRELSNRVNALKNKEAYLLAIKDRTKTVKKAMENQKPWIQMLNLVNTFTFPPALTSISVDEQDKILLSINCPNLEDVLRIVDVLIVNVQDAKIKNPQLVSFRLTKTGTYGITISFFAIFNKI